MAIRSSTFIWFAPRRCRILPRTPPRDDDHARAAGPVTAYSPHAPHPAGEAPCFAPPPAAGIGAALALLFLLGGGLLNFHGVSKARAVRQDMLASQDVLRATNELRLVYAQAVSDLRAYLLSGAERYGDDFRAGMVLLYEQHNQLLGELVDEPEQTAALTDLGQEFRQRDAQFEGALALAQGGAGAIAALANDLRALVRSSLKVRDLLEQVRARERARFDALVIADRQSQQQLAAWVTGFFALAVAIALWLSIKLFQELAATVRAEKLILWQQRFSDAIIEHLPVMLYIKDAKTLKMVRVNRAVEKLTGKTREEMLDKDDHQFFPPHITTYMANERRFVDEYRGDKVAQVMLTGLRAPTARTPAPRSWRCRDSAPCDSRTGTSRRGTCARLSRAPCRTDDCGHAGARQPAPGFAFSFTAQSTPAVFGGALLRVARVALVP